MPKKKSRYKPPAHPPSYYSLVEIQTLIESGSVVVNPDAALDALKDFGWKSNDILRAIQRLVPRTS
jgi:hypothetical protein